MREFGGYIRVNAASIPTTASSTGRGERISAAFAGDVSAPPYPPVDRDQV